METNKNTDVQIGAGPRAFESPEASECRENPKAADAMKPAAKAGKSPAAGGPGAASVKSSGADEAFCTAAGALRPGPRASKGHLREMLNNADRA